MADKYFSRPYRIRSNVSIIQVGIRIVDSEIRGSEFKTHIATTGLCEDAKQKLFRGIRNDKKNITKCSFLHAFQVERRINIVYFKLLLGYQ